MSLIAVREINSEDSFEDHFFQLLLFERVDSLVVVRELLLSMEMLTRLGERLEKLFSDLLFDGGRDGFRSSLTW